MVGDRLLQLVGVGVAAIAIVDLIALHPVFGLGLLLQGRPLLRREETVGAQRVDGLVAHRLGLIQKVGRDAGAVQRPGDQRPAAGVVRLETHGVRLETHGVAAHRLGQRPVAGCRTETLDLGVQGVEQFRRVGVQRHTGGLRVDLAPARAQTGDIGLARRPGDGLAAGHVSHGARRALIRCGAAADDLEAVHHRAGGLGDRLGRARKPLDRQQHGADVADHLPVLFVVAGDVVVVREQRAAGGAFDRAAGDVEGIQAQLRGVRQGTEAALVGRESRGVRLQLLDRGACVLTEVMRHLRQAGWRGLQIAARPRGGLGAGCGCSRFRRRCRRRRPPLGATDDRETAEVR